MEPEANHLGMSLPSLHSHSELFKSFSLVEKLHNKTIRILDHIQLSLIRISCASLLHPLQFKQSISVAESIIVETNYIPTKAAKIIFNYNIYKKSDHSLVLTAQTTQVFMDLEGNLQLSNPEFYEEWKKSWIKE